MKIPIFLIFIWVSSRLLLLYSFSLHRSIETTRRSHTHTPGRRLFIQLEFAKKFVRSLRSTGIFEGLLPLSLFLFSLRLAYLYSSFFCCLLPGHCEIKQTQPNCLPIQTLCGHCRKINFSGFFIQLLELTGQT